MNFELIVDLEFDILDAAINECLPGYVPAGWVEFTRRQIAPASTLYDMYLQREGDLGDLGQLIVRKGGAAKSLMYVTHPKRPRRKNLSQQEWESQQFSQYPSEERFRRKLDFLSRYADEAEELYRRRKEHQERIIQALFNRLSDDSATALVFSGRHPPDPAPLDPLDGARFQVMDSLISEPRSCIGDP